jgi:hypothetical protein
MALHRQDRAGDLPQRGLVVGTAEICSCLRPSQPKLTGKDLGLVPGRPGDQ